MNKSYLQLSNVSMSYFGNYIGLNNVSLELGKGQILGVFAQSFNGKSSLCRTIAGLENISSGNVFLGNKDISTLSPKDRDISMTFGRDSFNKKSSVCDSVIYSLKLREYTADFIQKRWQNIEIAFELGDIKDIPITKLNKEQLAKVIVARLFIRESKLHIIDGISEEKESNIHNITQNNIDSNVDKNIKNNWQNNTNKSLQKNIKHNIKGDTKINITSYDLLCKAIQYAKQNNLTLIYTTDQYQDLVLADRVVVMSNSKIVSQGTLEYINSNFEHILVEQNSTINNGIEVGILTQKDNQYIIQNDQELYPTNPPISSVYLSKPVAYVLYDNMKSINYYYDIASEYNISKRLTDID